LTRQLLLFSRKQVLQPKRLNVNEVAMNLTKMLQRIVGEAYQVEVKTHPQPVFTRADAGMLEQVMMNLVVNARDAMPAGGTIFVETGERTLTAFEAAQISNGSAGRYVVLRVKDTGSGIPPENMRRIFEPFFTTKEPGKGTGLGLATVFGIVQQHHGMITIDSEVGRGTTFHIYLPAIEGTVMGVNDTGTKVKMRTGTETILLVEDEQAVRELTRTCFQKAGYQVLEAASGVEARRVWSQDKTRIDLLFTDMVMPGG
jgi:signal transduction histidine kinase